MTVTALAVLLAWVVLAVGTLRLEPRATEKILARQDLAWLAPVVLAGVAAMALTRGRVSLDEYTQLPLPDEGLLAFYLGDSGLPSLVHNLVFVVLWPAGNLSILFAIHIALYLAWVGLAWTIARTLGLSRPVALGLAAICAWDPTALIRFQEHRAYSSFLLATAVGFLGVVRDSPRLAFLGFGLATLDNPLCIAPLAGYALVRRGPLAGWTAGLVATTGLLAVMASLEVRPSAEVGFRLSWGLVGGVAGALAIARDSDRRGLAASLGTAAAAVLGIGLLGIMPVSGKLSVLLLPASGAALCAAAPKRAWVPVVVALVALLDGGLTVRRIGHRAQQRAAIHHAASSLADEGRPVFLGTDWQGQSVALELVEREPVDGIVRAPMTPQPPFRIDDPPCTGAPHLVLRPEDDTCLPCPALAAPAPLSLRACPP